MLKIAVTKLDLTLWQYVQGRASQMVFRRWWWLFQS